MELKSRRHTVNDLASAIELCYTNGWTDGLPVVPPTAERIDAMLEAGGVEPEQQLAFIENRQVSVTAEKVAINAVMAGCKAEYMPVVARRGRSARRSALRLPRPGDEHRRLGGVHGRERPDRAQARHQQRRQPVRPGLARQRDDRARGAARHAQRHRHAARRARPQQPRSRRQVHLLHRGERGRQPVAAVPHHARLPRRPERGDDLRRARAAPVFEPAQRDARRHPRHRLRSHEDLGGLRRASRNTRWSSPASTRRP